ncbi:MAG: hypothetical protein NTY96_07505 [Bacteroidetes bacterium]|nr:hypothetical protein [Bacteroidota bacterium]
MARKKTQSTHKPLPSDLHKSNHKGNKQISKKDRARDLNPAATFFVKSEIFLSRHLKHVLYASLFLTLILSILLFDIRFSVAGDDSAYVARAFDFINHFIFPSFQGPLYPVILGPFVAVFGISAVPLKSLSLLFMLGSVLFFYMAFKERIPPLIMTICLILLAINSFVLYYSSQTYTEAFFMFLQALTFYIFFRLFIDEGGAKSFTAIARNSLILAVCVLSLGLTRPIGFASAIAISAFFLLKAQWRNIIFFLVSFALLFLILQGAKSLIWGSSGIMFSGQAGNFMAKDYYNPSGGLEDIQGFFDRLIHNSNYYISNTLYKFLGLRQAGNNEGTFTWLTVFTVMMMCGFLVMVFRKNIYLLFTGIYSVISLMGIFLITQVMWIQDRYIISYFPLILLMLTAFFYYLFCLKGWSKLQIVLPVLALILFVSTFQTAANDVQQVRQIRDKYSGLSPDWENYCRISEWASENLPAGAVVACRKPSVSFVYGHGKNFFGITRINALSGDSLMLNETQKKLHYYFILTTSLDNRSLPDLLFYSFKNSLAGFGMIKKANSISSPFYIMKFPDSTRDKTKELIRNSNITGTDNPDTLKTWLKDPKDKLSFVFPDSLLNFLRKANVTHVIMANLRADGRQKNGNTNNTVERFMDYIRFKYPNIMSRIIQVGANDNEPASLYKINYDQAVVQAP